MTLKEALSQIHKNKNTQTGNSKKFSYKSAEKQFYKMMEHYQINNNIFKKKKNGTELFDFTDTDVELLRFTFDIYYMDPGKRDNAKAEQFDLLKYKNITDYVKESIKNQKYPLIQDKLAHSATSKELQSLNAIISLADKMTKIIAYACDNTYADSKIYDQLNDYLDVLLYTYSLDKNIKDSYCLNAIPLHEDSENGITSFIRKMEK